MDLSNESDRVIISQMLIKFADINSPSKPYSIHRQWTDRICEEFYGQVCVRLSVILSLHFIASFEVTQSRRS